MKQCTKCGVVKYPTEFYKDSKGADGLYSQCKTCKRELSQKNRDSMESEVKRIKRKESYERNKDYVLESTRAYYANNLNKERLRQRNYHRENPEKASARSQHRRAQMLNATVEWSDKQYIADLYSNCNEFNNILLSFGLGIKYEIDHIVPLNSKDVCGLHCEYNLQPLSMQDNRAKANKLMEEYL